MDQFKVAQIDVPLGNLAVISRPVCCQLSRCQVSQIEKGEAVLHRIGKVLAQDMPDMDQLL